MLSFVIEAENQIIDTIIESICGSIFIMNTRITKPEAENESSINSENGYRASSLSRLLSFKKEFGLYKKTILTLVFFGN